MFSLYALLIVGAIVVVIAVGLIQQ